MTPNMLPQLTEISTSSMIVTLLALLLGFLNALVQTGKFLGKWTAPASWGPYLVVGASFLGGFVTFIQGQPTPLTALSWVNAAVAGFVALLFGLTPGLAAHHFGAQVNHLRPAPESKTMPPPAPPAGLGLLAGTALRFAMIAVAILMAFVSLAACAPAKAVIDAADIVCDANEDQPEPAFVIVTCAAVDAAQVVIGGTTFQAKIPKEQATKFLAAHKRPTVAK